MRWCAALALDRIGDARSVEALCAALGDVTERVRETASSALRKIGDARAVEPLCAALGDTEHKVRENAIKALARIGALSVEPLCRTLEDTEHEVPENAVKYIAKIGAPSAGLIDRTPMRRGKGLTGLFRMLFWSNQNRASSGERMGDVFRENAAPQPRSPSSGERIDDIEDAVRALREINAAPQPRSPSSGERIDDIIRKNAILALCEIGESPVGRATVPSTSRRESKSQPCIANFSMMSLEVL